MEDGNPMSAAVHVAEALHLGEPAALIWQALERALSQVFGHRLFTVLADDEATGLLVRLHSSRADINPVGGCKRVTQSPWTEHVLRKGDIFRGSSREDLKAVFSDHEVLWSIGCESVLNIPVRKGGITIGSLNLLDEAGHYDDADLCLAFLFAQLAVVPLETCLDNLRLLELDHGKMERV